MSVNVYVISEPLAIDFIMDDGIHGFNNYLVEDDTICFDDPDIFT